MLRYPSDYTPPSIPALFQYLTARFHGREALRWFRSKEAAEGFQSLKWEELSREVKDLGLALIEMGLKKGDRFAIIGPNGRHWLVADLALASIGVVVVPIYPTLDLQTITEILKDSGAKGVFTLDEAAATKIEVLVRNKDNPTWIHISTVSTPGDQGRVLMPDLVKKGAAVVDKKPLYERIEQLSSNDLWTIIYTSGSTGQPKGVMLEHRHILENVAGGYAHIPSVTEGDDVYLSFLPLAHAFERYAHYFMLSKGDLIVYGRGFETLGEDLMRVEPTLIFSVPRVFEKFHSKIFEAASTKGWLGRRIFNWGIRKAHTRLSSGHKPWLFGMADRLVLQKIRARMGSRMRTLICGGGPLNPELGRFFQACGIEILQGYGMTEAAPVISTNQPGQNRIGTVGRPFPNVEVKIAPDGEVWARGPSIASGYFNKPQESAQTFDSEGWLHTGDLGELDADGFLTINGRLKELIVTSGGKKIAPQRLEQMFASLPWIEQVLVVGDNRPYAVALVVPRPEMVNAILAQAPIQKGSDKWKPIEDLGRLVLEERVWDLAESGVEKINAQLSSFETIKAFALMPSFFADDEGLITPTRKVKRRAAESKYSDLIGQLYSGQSFVFKNNFPILPRIRKNNQ